MKSLIEIHKAVRDFDIKFVECKDLLVKVANKFGKICVLCSPNTLIRSIFLKANSEIRTTRNKTDDST